MNKGISFLKLFGDIDEEYIAAAAGPWIKKDVSKIKKFPVIAACATLVLLLSFSAIYHEEVMAAWEHLTTIIGNVLGISDDSSAYTDIIGKSVTKENVTVTLKESAIDEQELWLAYSITNKNPEIANPILLTEVFVDGNSTQLDGTYTIDDTLVSRFCFEQKLNRLNKIGIDIKMQLMDPETQKILDEYRFNFKASPKELEAVTKEITIDKNVVIDDNSNLEIERLRYNLFDSAIYATLNGIQTDKEYFLIGEDSFGDSIQYTLHNYESSNAIFKLDPLYSTNKVLSLQAKYLKLQLYILDSNEKKEPAYYSSHTSLVDNSVEETQEVYTYEENESPIDSAVAVGENIMISLN